MRTHTTAGHLLRLITRTAPHACTDTELPVLNAIRLEADGDRLFAVATDRCTIAVDCVLAVTNVPWHGYVHHDDIATAQAWLERLDRTDGVRVGAARSGDTLILTFRHGKQSLRSTVKVDSRQGEFPDWRKVFNQMLDRPTEAIELAGFNPALLARFKPVGTFLHTWETQPGKPLVLTSDDGFLGGVMPCRQERKTRDGIVDEWRRALKRRAAAVRGTAYDLNAVWRDKQGDRWTYTGRDNRSGQPLMEMAGIEDDDPTPLDLVAAWFGPLARDRAAA